MSFLDDAGLAYFYNKIKQKFVRSVNAIEPDTNGNISITNVATADNLTSPDGQTSFGTYIYRTSGGDVSLESGPAELLYIDGHVDIVGRVAEDIETSATNGIIITVDADTWRSQVGSSGTYNFTYTASTNSWNPVLATYGLTASNVILSSVSASVSGNITSASVNKTDWESNSGVLETGSYYFYYIQSNWTLDNNQVNLVTYGITITGTPKEGDIITVDYIAATPNSTAIVTYTKAEQGIINVTKPTAFQATGFNQCDASTMFIPDVTIANNAIIASTGNFVCYCKAVGGVDNGYVAYSAGEYITNIGWCAELPQLGSTVVTTDQELTSSLASIPFAEDGYVVVAVSNKSDICIHPKWSGSADTQYVAYVSPSVITLPQTGIYNDQTMDLPLKSYGMPAVGNVADRLNLDAGTYIQRIGHYVYSASNLALVQSRGVPYDYDANHIYYVLNDPIVYLVTVDSNYIVNDWGTEEFLDTTVPVTAQTLYGQNLRDKLRLDVEPKKLLFTNITCSSFVSDNTYTDFPYKGTIPLTGVTSNMIPEVVFDMTQAISGEYAPIAITYNGGIYIYSANNTSITIPTIILWRFTS